MTNREFIMSQTEVDRLSIIQQVISKQISQVEAAQQLHLSTRQVRNLRRQYERAGVTGLLSKRRGKPSNHRLSDALKCETIELIRRYYPDFGPTFAHEKLTEQHDLALSVESVRQLMISADIWKGKKQRKVCVHQSRKRRSQRGELVQIDGSPHDWFEGRGPYCCLIVFVDDATSELLALHFVEQECTQGYFAAIEQQFKQHGRPLAYYSDRHSIFRINLPEAKTGDGDTQLGRALKALDIELICAHSPQAKGRVERANGILQDRLVKELRLKDISDIPTANAFLPVFIRDYNQRFAVSAANPTDAHRCMHCDDVALKRILSQQYSRKISKNLEISYDNVLYQIQTGTPSYAMRGANVIVCEREGEITLLYKEKALPYKTLDKHNRPAPIQTRKEVQQASTLVNKPKANHPWRQAYSAQLKAQQQTQAQQ